MSLQLIQYHFHLFYQTYFRIQEQALVRFLYFSTNIEFEFLLRFALHRRTRSSNHKSIFFHCQIKLVSSAYRAENPRFIRTEIISSVLLLESTCTLNMRHLEKSTGPIEEINSDQL